MTIGVDLAASARRTAVCRVVWEDREEDGGYGAHLTPEFLVPEGDEDLPALVRTADKTGPDCPLGWCSEPSSKRGAGPGEARGRRLLQGDVDLDSVVIEPKRVVPVGDPVEEPGIVGVVIDAWHPDGPGAAQAHRCVAVVREVAAHGMPDESR
ncbi:hypothetical protein ACYF6T_28760 [Streptomyces sp. 7R007]